MTLETNIYSLMITSIAYFISETWIGVAHSSRVGSQAWQINFDPIFHR